MNKLCAKIKAFKTRVDFNSLRDFINSLNINELNYEAFINMPETKGDYGRNILTLEPFECVLINWPVKVASAVHLHKGLFGYVWVLEGELDNISYRFEADKLVEYAIDRYRRDDLIPEPEGIIHKLKNNSNTQRAITLHFYYPAIQSFAGMKIFNLEKGEVGILSAQAKTACWKTTKGHFKEIQENAFEFISFEEFKMTSL